MAPVTRNKAQRFISGHNATGRTFSHSETTKAVIRAKRALQTNISGTPVHRLSKSPTYSSWHGMISRCRDEGNASYSNYGARGIRVCDRWMLPQGVGLANFIADMGMRPEGKTIDRIDNDGNYEPSNCRWATPKEQRANQGSTH